ncbi:hypothetical protein CRD60_05585 [Bifidobacterium aemilianum]|uniref:Uncharacterized protein n=1 Tax=Bifidobacterium aemilianum TaxID=2493120 RepID=A0A366K7I7_9BIFI|nr:hypothetical protein [Bifidobacterium aemilianum]RBP97705.1 hypothetical protein CRD60_05585 [Bifidobacterium aemilianum]
MTFHMDSAQITRVSTMPELRQAAGEGAQLVGMWPLTDAKELANDAKYAENLQVRISRSVAMLLSGQEVTIPDAEFVYEGAWEIPGRPQELVDALLAANDAYEQMAAYSQNGDIREVMAAAGLLGLKWDQSTVEAVSEFLLGVEALVGAKAPDGGAVAVSADEEAVAERLAMVVMACHGLLGIIGQSPEAAGQGVQSAAGLASPVMIYINELCERLAIPRLFLSAEEFAQLLPAAFAGGLADQELADAQVALLAPLVAAEWKKHREDLLWDPEEAQRKAKEEDERKNKEALAAKFAHIPDDTNKPKVEL